MPITGSDLSGHPFDEVPHQYPPSAAAARTMSAPQANNGWLSGFLRKGDKTKKPGKRKAKKDGDSSSNDANDGSLDGGSEHQATSPEIDADGYTIRPPTTYDLNKREVDDFYSSDSDESGSEDPVSGIRVVIRDRPIHNGNGAGLAELQQTVKALSLATPFPRPPTTKRSQYQTMSSLQSSLNRAESCGSLSSTDFRMTPISLGSSLASSPLTRGPTDSVPIAVAFQESIAARFLGSDESRCESQMCGYLKFAFPSRIVQVGRLCRPGKSC